MDDNFGSGSNFGSGPAELKASMDPSTQDEATRNDANRIVMRWERMESDAINWRTHWQDCYENIVPRKEDVIATRMPGDRRDEQLYDSTAVRANEKLASALHGMLTNPETKFFEITFNDPRLMEQEDIKNWCQDVGDRMFRVLNNTNFQTEIYEIYIDLGAIGTACLFMGENEENVVHFSARAMKEIRCDENALGLIDVVYRLYRASPTQIIQEFGEDNVPGDVMRSAERASSDKMEIIHAVEPVDEVSKLNPANHKYKSTYVLRNNRFVLSKGKGFAEMPYAVPRWSKTTGEIYGRGPGIAMLPDIMMVNAMMLTVIQGAQKTVDPPLMVEDDGVIGQVRLQPGGLTIVRPGEQDKIKPLITDARIDFGEKMVENVRARINEGFHVDQLQLKDNDRMTAEEVKQRTEEMLRLMGPVLGRQHYELLKPMITRLFMIMYRKGLLPKAPVSVQGKSFDVRYTSLIARAQRVSEGQNIARALALVQPMIQIKPQIADVFDEEKIAREVWSIYGNSHTLLRTKQDLDKMRKQQAQAAQQQAQMMQEQHQANVAKGVAPLVAAGAQAQQGNQPGQG